MSYPDIEQRILKQWQETTDLVARLCNVSTSLLMRQNVETMEVISATSHVNSPYKAQKTEPLNGELYCETVIKTQQPLYVPNALEDPEWDHNPDIELGMISYYGVPVNWPNSDKFGTFCILDKVEKRLTQKEKDLIGHFAKIIEMTLELMISNKKLEQFSFQDGLTRISNRQMFDTTLQREWGRSIRNQEPISLILCDVDFFKKYNEHEGHLKGDECLKSIAQALALTSRRSLDLCARYGGEEFVLLLPNTAHDEACHLAERCRKNIYDLKVPHKKSEISDVVTISVGVCTLIAKKELASSTLIGNADVFLCRAKDKGRNRVESFN